MFYPVKRNFILQHTRLQLIMWEELDYSVTEDNGIRMLVTENICITYCLMSKEVCLMLPDSVRSLLVRNPFSHALFVATSQVRFLIHKEHGWGWRRTVTDKKKTPKQNLVQTRAEQDSAHPTQPWWDSDEVWKQHEAYRNTRAARVPTCQSRSMIVPGYDAWPFL